MDYYVEPEKKLPVKAYDAVVAGGGTGGVLAAVAAARTGARTALIESKGYVGGTAVEGGTALHSFYNLGRAFNVPARQVVKGLPQELIERLVAAGGSTGHAPVQEGYSYDEVCTAVDVEIYKLVAANMLDEAGVTVYYNTSVVDAAVENGTVLGAMIQNRSGRQMLKAEAFIDATGYGDLCAYAGAQYVEPNDHQVANSIGVGGVSVEGYCDFLKSHGALWEFAYANRDGKDRELVRISSVSNGTLPEEYVRTAKEIGMHSVISSMHDNYFMFLKLNYSLPVSPTNADAVSLAELELRRRQAAAIQLLRKYVPGCSHAFIARSSPSLSIRRGRAVRCDYDMTMEDIINAHHFEDDVMSYGFHDLAPRVQIKDGGTYGLPYRALLVSGLKNMMAVGMMITTDWEAHMSTRNTVSCMAQGQAAGTAAALAVKHHKMLREVPYAELRKELIHAGVYLEN